MRYIGVLALAVLSLLLPAVSVSGHEGLHELIDAQKKKVEKAPSDPALRFELGSLYGSHGDLELALKNLERVDALAPGKFSTDLVRSQAYLVVSDFAKAKEALDRQLASHPENPRGWLLRARAEQHLGQDKASLADFREALKRTPSPEPDLIQEVSDALAKQGFQEEAAAVLYAGIERLGRIPSLVLRSVDLAISTRNFDTALRLIDETQKDAPRPEPWMARRATILREAGRIEESRAAWKALAAHLAALPERERASHAMTQLADEARKALEPDQSR
jgi:tetratricopeptide (TPR) repeat protein